MKKMITEWIKYHQDESSGIIRLRGAHLCVIMVSI
jgi:hypothetical protein